MIIKIKDEAIRFRKGKILNAIAVAFVVVLFS